jgi:acylphosphatase
LPVDDDAGIVRARVRVTGVVQGVYFRQETSRLARSLSLAGWVRNAADGSVEAVFEGTPERVEFMVSWCRRGPVHAEVEHVEIEREQPERIQDFEIR